MARRVRDLLLGKCRRIAECADLLVDSGALGAEALARECARVRGQLQLAFDESALMSAFGKVQANTLEIDARACVAGFRGKKGAPRRCLELLEECATFNEALLELELKIAPSDRCEECQGDLREDGSGCWLVCTECNLLTALHPEDSDVIKIVTAVKPDVDHMKNSLDYLRKLQGQCSVDASAEEIDAIRQAAVRDQISVRNISLQWFRSVLQELELTKLNMAIPALMRQLFEVDIPQLSDSEEREIADGMVHDNAIYMHQREDGAKRGNALAYPYNCYRQIDLKFPPGHKKRQLLALINLQGAQTLQKHEDTAYEICVYDRREPTAIGPPPMGPFSKCI
jgi:hypothetical protein